MDTTQLQRNAVTNLMATTTRDLYILATLLHGADEKQAAGECLGMQMALEKLRARHKQIELTTPQFAHNELPAWIVHDGAMKRKPV